MAVYYKPQSPIQSGEDFIYPITTADQVKVDKDTRLNAVGVYLKNIDNSTDTTVYGNNATTLGGVAASDYALKTDTAPDSSKLGGKAPEYYLQPRNLLDNSDFRNPVNQREVSSVTTTGYTIDRWFLQNTGDGISISDDGVTFNATNSLIVFLQKINKEIRKVLIGKTITVAATDSSGNVGIVTCVVPNFGEGVDSAQNSIGDTGLKVNIYTRSTDDTLHIRLLSDSILSPVTIVNIALYEGSYTAEILPPYVPKGYAAELAECQRYYLPVSEYWNMGVILTGTGYICLNIPTNIKMIISPKTIMSNPRMYHPAYDWVDLTYRTLEWHAPFYRIIFDWPSSIQASISDIVLINGVTGLSADL